MKILSVRRVLLIVAPTLIECAWAARANGLTPGRIVNFRNVTRAMQLRGTAAGTPFVAINRDAWPATPEGYDLDRAVDTLLRTGRLRIAQPDDIAASREIPDGHDIGRQHEETGL